jgi:hypothetical protein
MDDDASAYDPLAGRDLDREAVAMDGVPPSDAAARAGEEPR